MDFFEEKGVVAIASRLWRLTIDRVFLVFYSKAVCIA